MRYLLDASALIPLVIGRGKRLIAEASNEDIVTTDLAIYEACNGLWKLATLLNSISPDDAIDIAQVLKDLAVGGIIKTLDFHGLDITRTLSVAHAERMTFYDASYITAAESAEAKLVTEDDKLRKRAGRFVGTMTYAEFEGKLSESHA